MAFDDDSDFCHSAVEFLGEALERGARGIYAASRSRECLLEDLSGLDDLECHLARGALQVAPIAEQYERSGPVQPHGQVARYAAATESALADGFTGLCVAADATAMVSSVGSLDEFGCYEILVDRYMAHHPFAALCAYNRGVLGSAVTTQVAAVHPAVWEGSAPFQIVVADDDTLAVGGELDLMGHEALSRALEWIEVALGSAGPVIDLAGIEFIDHRALMVLDQFAAARGRSFFLESASPIVGRVVDLLELRHVEVRASGRSLAATPTAVPVP